MVTLHSMNAQLVDRKLYVANVVNITAEEKIHRDCAYSA